MNIDGRGEDGSLHSEGAVGDHRRHHHHHNLGLSLAHTSPRGDSERFVMETAGRGYSELYRNTSEEMILKSLMDNPIGVLAPSMEMLGFKSLTQNFRGDSEELFNNWLLNGEIPGFSSGGQAHRSRQSSRRMSTEHAPSSNLQNGTTFHNKMSDEISQQNPGVPEEQYNEQRSLRNASEKETQPSNLLLAKAWFQNTQPMTRSRSSELRRRYSAMQNTQTPTIMDSTNNLADQNNIRIKQDFGNISNFCDLSMGGTPNQLHSFMSPPNSSSPPLNTHPMAAVDTVSSVVSMLKGTLERKKSGSQADRDDDYEGDTFRFYPTQEIASNAGSDRGVGSRVFEPARNFGMLSTMQMNDHVNSSVEWSVDLNMGGFITSANHIPPAMMSREPSQSESSAAAHGLSSFEGCDGPQSAQTPSVCGNETLHHGSRIGEVGEKLFASSFKNNQKKETITRISSVSSGLSGRYKGDPTKKRRDERSRKMAEAKERNSTPALPSDMQSVLKRCENLEKEVRSLKLNLSFMNRKDSEQTKQIEDLQKQNEDLSEEKERLLEEIERIISETAGRM